MDSNYDPCASGDCERVNKRPRAAPAPKLHLARTCQCVCHDHEVAPQWTAAARRLCDALHQKDQEQGLVRLVGEELGPPHLASLLVGQMQLCLVCGEHLSPDFAEGARGGGADVVRLLPQHTHSFANCIVVHRKCREGALFAIAGLGNDLLGLLARTLEDSRFRALTVNTCNVLAGHYDPTAVALLVHDG